jgi:hypothetical protein
MPSLGNAQRENFRERRTRERRTGGIGEDKNVYRRLVTLAA